MMKRVFLLSAAALMVFGVSRTELGAYVLNGPKWPTTQVSYWINPNNIYVSDAVATTELQNAAAAWTDQTHANVRLVYAGQTSGSSLGLNQKNEVFFRNESHPYAAAETYWWADWANRITEFDIVFYEGSYSYFAGTSGCSNNGVYIADLAIHEFGHALGLGHSEAGNVTMEAYMPSYCDVSQLSLEGDDIAGVEALYPPVASAQPPSPPSALSVTVNASAPTSSLLLSWADNANNEGGFRIERSVDGASFAQVAQVAANVVSYNSTSLSAGGTYYYRVYAYNGDGPSSYSNVAWGQTQAAVAPPPAPEPSGATLTGRAYKVKGLAKVDLKWSGLTGTTTVDVYRNGNKITSTPNDGAETDPVNTKGGGSYKYRVCASGSSVCSNEAAVAF